MNDNHIPSDNGFQDAADGSTRFFDAEEQSAIDELTQELPDAATFDDFEQADADDGTFYDDEDDAPLSDDEYTDIPRPSRSKRRPMALRILLPVAKGLLALVLIAAILAGGLLGYLTVTEYYPAHAETAQRGAVSASEKLSKHSLRLLTFNTGHAGVSADDEKALTYNMSGVECILEDAAADVLLLQEVDADCARSFGKNQWLQYEYDLKDYESRFAADDSCKYVPFPITSPTGRMNSGIATFSRYDITSATRYSLPCSVSWPTRVISPKRCLLVTRLPIANSEQELVIVNLRLADCDGGEERDAQVEQLLTLLREEYEKGNFVIAGGDFNRTFYGSAATASRPAVPELPTDEWRYAYDAGTASFAPRGEDDRPCIVDGYIVSPNVQVDSVRTLDEDFVYSDHNPVLLEVTLLP